MRGATWRRKQQRASTRRLPPRQGSLILERMRWLLLAISMLIAGCGSEEVSSAALTAPTALGVIRSVPLEQVTDSSQWGPDLDFALEVEFWDLISNSSHGRFDAWHDKVSDYLDDNPAADPR